MSDRERTPLPYEGPAGPPPGADGAVPGGGGPGAQRPRRSTARRVTPLIVAAWAVLEIWLLMLLGSKIGALGVFGVLLLGIIIGAVVIKRAGRRAWRGLAESLQPGAAPGARTDGSGNALTMLAGLLLMFPGLVSDALGLVLLLPPVRSLIRRRTNRFLEAAAPKAGLDDLNQAFTQARIHRPDGKVVQGEVVRDEDEPKTP
ncbi:FxsA family protein [Streptomyces sp. A7024]|uniref:FxsA family protein n=1 Tax=Streptomyces coryli TaxID=1128680 RepID=A0A6G4U207_9ACTN|nr:FxsA family membrane protein [Streptomyces coryli]NGN65271.1 FxsA family protein [Streptomyces coryli]